VFNIYVISVYENLIKALTMVIER